MPDSSTATISSVVATGRRMNWRDGFMEASRRAASRAFSAAALGPARPVARCAVACPPVAPRAARRPLSARSARAALRRSGGVGAVARDHLDAAAFAQLVGAVGDDEGARRDAARDRRGLALHGS